MQDKVLKLQELTDLFKQNEKQYKSANYDEANTRVDFIDKFFELLDWDVSNTQGFAENYREVVREDKIIIGEKPKAPDYSFRIGGFRKFFVEAKKPGVNIKDDLVPAYQVRRYGYTAKVPLSILTDFEEFSIYDTRIKPNKNDKASVGRIFYCSYDEYIKNLDFIYNSFSKNAILKGSFDKYVEENKNKKGTSEVDKEFLSLIENWRNSLAKNIALRNIDLSIYELNYAVQKIIDRIIFLRIAEDRQMEEYNTLKDTTKNESIYRYLNEVFKTADDKYNSGLFKKEKFFDDLKIDDKVLKPILTGLYYPDCPYEFSIFSTEILGNIYEQFLGKTIRLTSSHQAKVEEKPEVKKAGGVYYTPQYIVDYIVQNTVGEKVKDKTPTQIKKLRICDPACGSGSFLIGAYRYLLNFHLQYYIKDENRSKASKNNCIYQISDNNWALTIKEKQEILLSNIFGVDIDSQAVEVTKLSLLLKLMEGENEESAGSFFKYSDLQLLPDLSNNIKCGNSLIGSDFYNTTQLSLFGDEQIRKINVFDWEKEFSKIFNLQKGFDIIIGNPPYVRIHEIDESSKKYYKNKYISAEQQFDLYLLFYEKGLNLLNKNGLLGFITSNKFCITSYGKSLRNYIVDNFFIISITDVSHNSVFGEVSTYPYIFIIQNKIDSNQEIKILNNPEKTNFQLIRIESQNTILKGNEKTFTLGIQDENISILNKLESYFQKKILNVYRGRGTSKDITETQDEIKSITNKQINRFVIKPPIFYRKANKFKNDFDKKLLMKKICYNLEVAIDETGELNPINTVYVIKTNDNRISLEYILGILNSRLMTFYARKKYMTTSMRGGFIELRVFEVEQLPVAIPSLLDKYELEKLVKLITIENKKHKNLKIEQEKDFSLKKIKMLETEIDKLVYTIYNLSNNEIKQIETNVNPL